MQNNNTHTYIYTYYISIYQLHVHTNLPIQTATSSRFSTDPTELWTPWLAPANRRYGNGPKPCTPGEHHNSSQIDVCPLKNGIYRYWPIPIFRSGVGWDLGPLQLQHSWRNLACWQSPAFRAKTLFCFSIFNKHRAWESAMFREK
jgi:hypothetical protein